MSTMLEQKMPPHLDTCEKRREFICGLEAMIAAQQFSVFDDNEICPLNHSFCDGMYMREIFIPAGILLTGKIHRHQHPNFLLMGTVSMITEDGGLCQMSAPQALISPAGCKRAIYTHTDVRWVTVHLNPNGHTGPCEALENEVIAKEYAELGMEVS
jgi:hypothetical protein